MRAWALLAVLAWVAWLACGQNSSNWPASPGTVTSGGGTPLGLPGSTARDAGGSQPSPVVDDGGGLVTVESNICSDGGICPTGACCRGVCCTIGTMCCAGRCLQPTINLPSCEVSP